MPNKSPPRLHLLWLTTRLARSNHVGAQEQDWMTQMQHLGAQLQDEDAPLVCWADLHLAVNATNRYDFALASQCLARRIDQPRSVPGLRYWARAVSNLGQHAAFNGQTSRAIVLFKTAIDVFAALSDPQQRHKKSTQTAVYRALVEIDHSDPDLQQQIPAARPYIEKLQQYLAAPSTNPLTLLADVLPFNFH
jgi:hypothetical protein